VKFSFPSSPSAAVVLPVRASRGREKISVVRCRGIIKIEFIAGCRFYWSYTKRTDENFMIFIRALHVESNAALEITGKVIFCLSLCGRDEDNKD
jgi:hypothetical protein